MWQTRSGGGACSSSSPTCLGASPKVASRPWPSMAWQQSRVKRRHRVQIVAVWPPHDLHSYLPMLTDHLFLAYERVVMPCHNMNCGDVVYRSTLDPVLRLEQKGINPQGVALVALIVAYLFARPGVLEGAWDYYVLDKIQRIRNNRFITKDNIRMGKKLATGGFGTVYRAELTGGKNDAQEPIIVKKAKEFGEAEVWMNERLMRAAPACFAAFLTAFEEGGRRGPGGPLWLVWRYEGDFTLYDLMQKKDWPYNLEPLLFGQELDLPRGPQRRALILQVVMRQVLEALQGCHRTGIVHRDVKPQNVIVAAAERRVKMIDLGAAADLRVGINYVPNEFLLDPRYAPPQQYIMSKWTPKAPPPPVAAMLSPILWQMNAPDRFDMYSVGVMLLQAALPALRTDAALINFRRKLESVGFDMRAWRASMERRGGRDMSEGLETLDAGGGAGWELVCALMAFQPRRRLSASRALAHPFCSGARSSGPLAAVLARVGDAADAIVGDDSWLEGGLGGGGRVGGLTEAQLSDELGPEFLRDLPLPRNVSATIAWWQRRQGAFNRVVEDQKLKAARLQRSMYRSIRESKRKPFRLLDWGRTN